MEKIRKRKKRFLGHYEILSYVMHVVSSVAAISTVYIHTVLADDFANLLMERVANVLALVCFA